MGEDKDQPQTGREIFEDSDSGAGDRPFIPTLRSDKSAGSRVGRPPRTLSAFREAEGREARKRRLKELWKQLPVLHQGTVKRSADGTVDDAGLTPEAAQRLITMYEKELLRKCGGHSSATSPMGGIGWKEFREYAEAKETGAHPSCPSFSPSHVLEELWQVFHDELDLDGNGRLDAQELSLALTKVGTSTQATILYAFHNGLVIFQESRFLPLNLGSS
jgi:solute carrier family 25 phosphate transporter 23/24/25/41